MSTVTPTFYYFFIIFLTCYISVPSFIYNLCWVLLLGNHLNYSSLSYIVLALSSAVTNLATKTLIFHDFQGPTIKFDDFPGLENEILKFYDFPGFP